MNKKIFAITTLAILIGITSKSQSFGEIHGKVTDQNGISIPGVIITADNSIEVSSAVTDEDGRFKLKPLRPGAYNVRAMMMGMDTTGLNGVLVEPEKILKLKNFILRETSFTTGIVEIGDYKVPLIRFDGCHLQTLTAEELKNNAAANSGKLSTIVATMSSEIKPAPNGEDLYFRGSRAGSVLYFIDGMKSRETNINIPSSGISSISVYTGGMPAKYGDTTGGVVVVETKSYLDEYYRKLSGK